MSSYNRDLVNNEVFGVSLAPSARTANTNGTGIDLITGDGLCSAIIVSGTITDGGHTIAIQESDASGGTYSAVTPVQTIIATTNNTYQVVSFQRTKRYVRATTTVTGSPSTGGIYSVLLAEQLKTY